MSDLVFHIADYVVLVFFVLISMSIGVYYGLIKKQKTTEEYLFGNRKMHMLPVALSLIVTFQSATSVLGIPTEIYMYDTMVLYFFIAIMIASFIQAMFIVPLLYPLKLTSVYEYLGRRFRSRSVQLLGALIGMLQTLLYVAVVLYAPALALQAVVGIPLWISIVLIGAVGTIYNALGGFKSVIWTDVLQCVILYCGLTTFIVLGTMKMGGFRRIMELAYDGKRLILNRTSFDPRVRHTIWSTLIGGTFTWLPNCCSQSAVQRICAMKNLRDSKRAVLLNIPTQIIYGGILILTGLMIYSFFSEQDCDPRSAGFISNNNQLVPYFMMRILSDIPGLSGLFIAALFSGTLSTLSSGINSLAANTVFDLLFNILKDKSQGTKTCIAKIAVLVYGSSTIVLAYLAQYLHGPVSQMVMAGFGACGGPIVGLIFLGASFPQANWIGALSGGIAGIVLNMWIAVCSVLYGTKTLVPINISTNGCFANKTLKTNITLSENIGRYSTETRTNISSSRISPVIADNHLAIYDISYLYFGLIGFFIALIIGLLVSICTPKAQDRPTEPEYLFPWVNHFRRQGYSAAVSKASTGSIIKNRECVPLNSSEL